MPVPSGLVRKMCVAGLGAGVGQHPVWRHLAGDGVPEFDFWVRDGVAAEERDPGFDECVGAALEDRPDDIGRGTVLGKRRDGERRARRAAHRIHVAERIGRGDPAEEVRVVDDRREEVDGLDQRRSVTPPIHAGIVGRPVVDKDAIVGGRRQVAEDGIELGRRQFAGAAGAVGVVGQALHRIDSIRLRGLKAWGLEAQALCLLPWTLICQSVPRTVFAVLPRSRNRLRSVRPCHGG